MNATQPSLEITTSHQFTTWLYEQNLSLAFTSYQAGKIFFVGLQPTGQLSIFERSLERCMGLCIERNSLYVSTLYQLWRFENILASGQTHENYDAIYLPQMSYVTGDLDIHDVAVSRINGQSQPIFINTLFSCLATVSPTHSFQTIWKPPFISQLAAEDRCHLNGLAMSDRQPKYVTMIGQSNIAEGWRQHRLDGGCIMDISTNEVIASGLSMPHSPRWHQNKLWVLNSGKGEFGTVDLDTGKFEPITFCPGYLRGLELSGNYAIVGLSESRDNKTFQDLLLNDRLIAQNITPRCGLLVIDLITGNIVHSLSLTGVIKELYDVVVLPKIRRPQAIGFRSDEIRRMITIK